MFGLIFARYLLDQQKGRLMTITTDTEQFIRQIGVTEKFFLGAAVEHTRCNSGSNQIGMGIGPKTTAPGQNSSTSNLLAADKELPPSDHGVAALKVRIVTEVQSLFVSESKAAKMLDLKKKEFTELVRKGILPQPVQLGKYNRVG